MDSNTPAHDARRGAVVPRTRWGDRLLASLGFPGLPQRTALPRGGIGPGPPGRGQVAFGDRGVLHDHAGRHDWLPAEVPRFYANDGLGGVFDPHRPPRPGRFDVIDPRGSR